jgi:hypothetical protein
MLYVFGLFTMSIAWLLPGHYYPWTSFQQDVLAAGGVALVALGAAVGDSRGPARVPWIAVGAAALALVPALQFAFGLMAFHLDAVMAASYLLALALAIVTGLQLSTHDAQFHLLLSGSVALAALVSVGIAVVHWAGLEPMAFVEQAAATERAAANLRQPNQLASLLGLAAAATLGAFEARRIGAWIASAMLAVLGAGIVMTQSRAGWLFVATTVILWGLMRRRAALRTSPTAVATGVIAFVAAVFAFEQLNAWRASGVAVETIANRIQPGYRLLHWETLWDALMRQPWAGYGWLQVPQAQAAATLDHRPTFEFITAAHNQLLDLLLWNGLPLGLLVISGLTWWTISRLRHCANGATFSLWLGLAYLFAHSLVEFPLQYAYFLLPAGLMIGVIEAAVPAGATRGPTMPRWAFLALWAAMAALLTAIVFEYLKLEEAVRRARMAEARYAWQGAPPFVPDIHILDWQREYVRLMLAEPRVGMADQELQWMSAVAARYPSPGALSRLARAHALKGQFTEAELALRVLCHTSSERHCDATRRYWQEQSLAQPALASVPFPPTPTR